MLFIYNLYRFASIVVLAVVYILGTYPENRTPIYFGTLFFYFLFGLMFLYFWWKQSFKFKLQVYWSGIVDIIVVVVFIQSLGYLQSGLGILLNASIAVLSILTPGRLAVFFASLASCMFLGISCLQYVYGVHEDLSVFFSTGVHGAGFFATALTAWYLAKWVESSENLASQRAKELANMQRLNEYIVDRLQYGVIYIDADQGIRVINSSARQLLNLKSNQYLFSLKELSPELQEKYLLFLQKRKTCEQSAQAIVDNPYLQVHFYCSSYADDPSVLIILEDMLNIAQQAQQLKLASLGQFSASIAHELRNPLGVIAHATQMLGEEEYLNKDDSRLKELIIDNCNRMNSVIKNVLQMSRREQSQPEPIKIGPFLKQFKEKFCLINQCDIILKLSGDKKMTVLFDKSQLEQLLVILCDNTLQHGRDASGNVQINLAIESKAQHVMLHVCDTGPGIQKEIRDNIFDPFFSTVRTGFGMGLFIAKDLCEINQARLNLMDKDKDKGSCFTIHFTHNDEMRL
ncbi:MAG: two-component sensor histidine kinase [Alphaproteobacteria bacterium]|nr:two-component sensor histidine kinase [Alphaproteobacteria bacterium]